MKPYTAELCIRCKGNLLCGLNYCPLIAKKLSVAAVKEKFEKINDEFSTLSNSVLVGAKNYPNINLGVLGSLERDSQEKTFFDSPREWSARNLGINDVVRLRISLMNSIKKTLGVNIRTKYLEKAQEIALSSKPLYTDIKLSKKASFNVNFDAFTPPYGPSGYMKNIIINENPRIDFRIERFYNDYDAKAGLAIVELYKKGFEENFLSKALSVGAFGVKTERKIVPTRWAITAVDDNIGKQLIEEIKNYGNSENCAFFGGYLGNYYLILFFERFWSYELFESYMPNVDWNISNKLMFMKDYENYYGRKNYAENTSGGYYAARLAILEKLSKIRRQASVLCIRVITPEYYAPLGVWVVREATRKALSKNPIAFSDQELMLRYAEILLKKKFGIELSAILKESKLFKEMKHQKSLNSFKRT
ncbi:MAG: hypothetical protein ACP5OZ_03180 [Candidatus Woesearchaeota archaeon]